MTGRYSVALPVQVVPYPASPEVHYIIIAELPVDEASALPESQEA
jgi:hypothetical protein